MGPMALKRYISNLPVLKAIDKRVCQPTVDQCNHPRIRSSDHWLYDADTAFSGVFVVNSMTERGVTEGVIGVLDQSRMAL